MNKFKKLNIMDFRKTPGRIIEDMKRDGSQFVLLKNGIPVACLVPISEYFPGLYENKERSYEDFNIEDFGDDNE